MAEGKSVPVDITDALRAAGHDINTEDRVYELGDHKVKVRTIHDDQASQIGQEVFRFTGSLVGDDGKALQADTGAFQIQADGYQEVFMSHSPVDFVSSIERARFVMVERTILGAKNRTAARALTGVVSRSEIVARKGVDPFLTVHTAAALVGQGPLSAAEEAPAGPFPISVQ